MFPVWRGGEGVPGGTGGAGEALAGLARFRREFCRCLWRRGDALCKLANALLTTPAAGRLPFLSLEPAFRRGHGMICKALDKGRIAEEALRDLVVRYWPEGWPPAFAIEASTYPRPIAETSPGREWQPHSCQGALRPGPGRAGRGLGVPVAGPGVARAGFLDRAAGHDPRQGAGRRHRQGGGDDHRTLRAAGEGRVPLYVLDARYDEAPLTWDLRDHLDEVQILVRVRNDRVLYRDPAPEPLRQRPRPRPRKHSAQRFECQDPATWEPPDQELTQRDGQYGRVSVMAWGGLHPRLWCRGRFAGFWPSPVIRCHLVRVTVQEPPGRRKAPGPLWLWWAGPTPGPGPNLAFLSALVSISSTFSFAKHSLGWDRAALRYPEQVARWTWLIIAALTMLRLARPTAADCQQRWERRRAPGRLIPGRVRRDFYRLAALAVTSARPPKTPDPDPDAPKAAPAAPPPPDTTSSRVRPGTTRKR